MTKEQKLEIAKKFYDEILSDYSLEFKRDDDISADFVWVSNTRGPGGLIVGDDGGYLFCQSAHGYEYWKEEYKKGTRSNK